MIFLETLPAMDASSIATFISVLKAAALALALAFLFVAVLIWVYTSFAFMAIAKKAKQSSPGIAWIPGIGPAIIAYKASKMHWWPWLLIIGFFIPVVGFLASIAFLVFLIIWLWKLFERIGKPGWWAILYLIPVVNLIIIGIAAWSKD